MPTPSPFFSYQDFQEVADIKGEIIEVEIPQDNPQSNYQFGLIGNPTVKKIQVKTILSDRRQSTIIREGAIFSGDLTAKFADPIVPNPLPSNCWFVYQGIKYKPEEQTPILIQGKAVVRTVKLTQDPGVRSDYRSSLEQGR
jgi:hypothetical protein